jgi:hypothetical protein
MNLFAGEEKAETATQFALTTSTLQGTYFMLAARALGLDVGAMGGFDTCALDARSSGTARRSGSRTSATATHSKVFPRTPRAAAFDEVARFFLEENAEMRLAENPHDTGYMMPDPLIMCPKRPDVARREQRSRTNRVPPS